MFENYGLLAVKQGRRVLPVLVHILAPLPVSTIAKRFKTTKHVSAGEYASACNVDDIAKQTEVMKRMHQYLSRMYEEQSECQIGFKNVSLKVLTDISNCSRMRSNYCKRVLCSFVARPFLRFSSIIFDFSSDFFTHFLIFE